jgi:hypothetical protein
MIDWQYYPKSRQAPKLLVETVKLFEACLPRIDSARNELKSNEVLACLKEGLKALEFDVEKGPRISDSVSVPVLFGRRGAIGKSFKADAFHRAAGVVLEVEAGRAVVNNQFLKDFFQACMMADTKFLIIAVRLIYRGQQDFKRVLAFFDTLYGSGRLRLPLKQCTRCRSAQRRLAAKRGRRRSKRLRWLGGDNWALSVCRRSESAKVRRGHRGRIARVRHSSRPLGSR